MDSNFNEPLIPKLENRIENVLQQNVNRICTGMENSDISIETQLSKLFFLGYDNHEIALKEVKRQGPRRICQ